jgi:hypothetical protein
VVVVAAIKILAQVWRVCQVNQMLAVKAIKQVLQRLVVVVAVTGRLAAITSAMLVVRAVQVLTLQLLSVRQHFMSRRAVEEAQLIRPVAQRATAQVETVVRRLVQVVAQRQAIMVAVVVAVWQRHQAQGLTAWSMSGSNHEKLLRVT